MSRRTALLGAVAVGTAACTPYTVDRERQPTPFREPEIDPDVALAAAVLADEQAVLDLIEATVSAHPRLERVLAAARSGHEAHIRLLEDAAPEPSPSPSGSASPSPGSSASPSPGSPGAGSSPSAPTPTRVPREAARALAAVARAEDELGITGKRNAFSAQSGAFARVLASMAAAAAQQAAQLATARPGGAR